MPRSLFFVLLVAISSIPSIALMLGEWEYPRYFVKEINIVLRDPHGAPLPSAKTYVYLLKDEEQVLLAEAYTNSLGIAHLTLALPYKCSGNICASVNLKVVAIKQNVLAVWFFAIDPSYEALGPRTINVTAYEYRGFEDSKRVEVEPVWEHVYNTTYKLTPVLRFATYYGVSARWEYPIGSKIKVQAKCRWPPNSSYPWYNCGYTEITLDVGLGLINPVSGPWKRTLYFDIKYRYSMISLGAVAYEEVYATDTPHDVRKTDCTRRYWDGHPVNGPAYYDVRPGEYRVINVTGGSAWDFSVAVSFSYPWSITVTLGVDKVQAPYAELEYFVTGSQGRYVRIVSVGDTDFLDTIVYWHD